MNVLLNSMHSANLIFKIAVPTLQQTGKENLMLEDMIPK